MATSASSVQAEAFFDTALALERAETAQQGTPTAVTVTQLVEEIKRACKQLDDEKIAKENTKNELRQLVDNPITLTDHIAIRERSGAARAFFSDDLDMLRTTLAAALNEGNFDEGRFQVSGDLSQLLDERTGQVQQHYDDVVHAMQEEIEDQRQRTAIYREHLREVIRRRDDANARVNNAQAYAEEAIDLGVTPENVGDVLGQVITSVQAADRELRAINGRLDIPLGTIPSPDDNDDDLTTSVVTRHQREPIANLRDLLNAFNETAETIQANMLSKSQITEKRDLPAKPVIDPAANDAKIQELEGKLKQAENSRDLTACQTRAVTDENKAKEAEVQKLHAENEKLCEQLAASNFNARRQMSGLTEVEATALFHCVERLIKNGKSLRKVIEHTERDPTHQVKELQSRLNDASKKCKTERGGDLQKIKSLEDIIGVRDKELREKEARFQSKTREIQRLKDAMRKDSNASRLGGSGFGKGLLVNTDSALQGQIDKLLHENSELQRQATELKARNASAQQHGSDAGERERYHGMTRAEVIGLVEKEISTLNYKILKKEMKIEKLRDRKRELKNEIGKSDKNSSISISTDNPDPEHTKSEIVGRLNNRIKVLEKSIDDLVKEATSTGGGVLDSEETTALENRINKLSYQLLEAEEQVSDLRTQIRKPTLEYLIQGLEEQIVRAQEDHKKCFDNTDSEDPVTTQEIKSLRRIVNILDRPAATNADIVVEILTLNERLVRREAGCSEEKSKLQTNIKNLNAIIDSLKDDRTEDVEAINRFLQENQQDLRDAVGQLEQELVDLKAAQSDNIDELKRMLDLTGRQLANAKHDNDAHLEALGKLKKQVQTVEQRENNCTSEKDKLKDKLKQLDAELKGIVEAKDQEIKRLNDQITQLEKENDEQHRDGTDDNAALIESVRKARSEAAQLRTDLNQANTELKRLERILEIQTPTYEEQKNTITERNNDTAHEQANNVRLRERVTELEGEVAAWIARGRRALAPGPPPHSPEEPLVPGSPKQPPPVQPKRPLAPGSGAGSSPYSSSSSAGTGGLFGPVVGEVETPPIGDDKSNDPFNGSDGGQGGLDYGDGSDGSDEEEDKDDEATKGLKKQVRDLGGQLTALERQTQLLEEQLNVSGEGGDAALTKRIKVLQARIQELELLLRECREETWKDRRKRVYKENAKPCRGPKRKREDPAKKQQDDWLKGGWKTNRFEPVKKRGGTGYGGGVI